jgi:predicted amidophosphoribosyltransferase
MIFTGIGSDICPECEGEMTLITNTNQEKCLSCGLPLGDFSKHHDCSRTKSKSSPKEEVCKTCQNDPRFSCKVCGKKYTQNAYGEPVEGNWAERFDSFYFIESDGKWNEDIGVPSPEKLKSFISSTIKEEQNRIIKLIKEKGLHLGYKNDIINLINNL